MVHLHFVAARADAIKPYLNIVREAELIPLNVDIDIFAIQRVIQYLKHIKRIDSFSWCNQDFFLIEIDAIMLRCFYVARGTCEVSWKGNIPCSIKMEHEKIAESIHRLVSEVQHDFLQYAPYEILLTGDNTDNTLAFHVQQHTQVPTSILNPLNVFSIGNGIDPQALQKVAPAMLIPMGLVLRQDKPC